MPVWGKEGADYPIPDKVKFFLVSRSIGKIIPKGLNREKAALADIGCGYDARILRGFEKRFASLHGFDFEVADALINRPGYNFHLGDILKTFPQVPDNSFDFIVFLSILEHLEDPAFILREAGRILRPGGRLFFNSPTWFGKWVLENIIASFKFLDPYGETPKQYDTHKMYYDPKDMWPVLVKAGFVSTRIRIWRSNFMCSISGYAEKAGEGA